MISGIMGLMGNTPTAEITNRRWNRFMQPIINPSLDAGALDSSQSWLLEVLDTGTEWRAFFTGANTQLLNYTPDNQDYINNDSTFMAIKTKSNDVISGWDKVLDVNGDPKPIFKPTFINGRFDKWQVWIRTILKEGGVCKAWYIGDDGQPTYDYRVGYATSNDDGETWTRYSTSPIYTDFLSTGGSRGIVVLQVVHDDTNYKMLYAGLAPNIDGFKIAESSDGITGWSITHSGLFANQEYGFPSNFKYIDGVYYLWLQRGNMMPAGNLGPCREVVLFRSTDLDNWINMGVQMTIRGSQEFGIGNHVKYIQKPNGNYAMLSTWYINRTQSLDPLNGTKEPSVGTKIADSDSDTFIMNSECEFSYPSYVAFHAPLGYEMGLTEVISGTAGTISGTGAVIYAAERDFIKLNGSQTITFANPGINGAAFAVKMRVETLTTGTRELFKIGNDVLFTIESGKLRVRLSSDGVTYQKDYITSVNVSKPVGMDYFDPHLYMGFVWDGSTIRIFNDFVEFTSGEITKTVDNSLTVVNNSGSDILIGQNTAIELRSVSVLNAVTLDQYNKLDI